MKLNKEFKNEALAALKGNWAPAVVASLVLIIIAGCVEGVSFGAEKHPLLYGPYGLLSIFVLLPLGYGSTISFKKLLSENDEDILGNMFRLPFSNNYWKIVGTMLLTNIYILLWSLLFLVPGIIKSFSYAMTPYVLSDEPELTANQAIDKSRAMMKGHKFDLFWLYLSFIGWALLCIISLGIGFLWLIPYMETSVSGFYAEVKAEYEAKQDQMANYRK